MKIFTSLMILFSLLPKIAFGMDCTVVTEEPNAAIWIPTLIFSQAIEFSGSELPSANGFIDGASSGYNGPADGRYISYGPHINQSGSEVMLISDIYITSNWQPTTYRTCRKRHPLSGKCISWNHHDNETGFTADVMFVDPTDGQQKIIMSKVFKNLNSLRGNRLHLPEIICRHPMNSVEVRVHSLYGGSVDFRVNKITTEFRWNN